MNDLAKLAELAARVLNDHPDLPSVAAIMVGWTTGRDKAVRLQLRGGGDPITAVAHWAQALHTTVTVTAHGTYVSLDAVTTVDGATVLVWDHLGLSDAVELAARIGLPLPARGGHVEIAPAVLLSTTAATVAVT